MTDFTPEEEAAINKRPEEDLIKELGMGAPEDTYDYKPPTSRAYPSRAYLAHLPSTNKSK